MKKAAIFLLRIYKIGISPVLESTFGKACRFTPSCSEYMTLSIEKYGTRKGLALGLRRIAKCHPWGSFGFDPVPETK